MRIALLLVALLLGGCVGTGRQGAPANIYDFGPPDRAGVENGAARLAGRMALEVRAAPWLEGPHIDYRLAYGDPLKRLQYADSRWAAPPASMLAQQLRRQLGFAAVNSGIAAECVLRVELQEFSHVFSAPNASQGRLQGQVSLIDGKRRQIASRAISIESQAPSADAAGGVKALVQASLELGQQLAGWLDQRDRANDLKACGPGR